MSMLKGLLLECNESEIDGSVDIGLDVLDTREDYQDIISYKESLEKLSDIAIGLEGLISIGESKSTLSNFESALFKETTDILLSDLGIRNPIISLESADGTMEYNIALESFKDIAKKVWNAIKKSADNLRSKIDMWVIKALNTVEKLKAKGVELAQKAESIGNVEPRKKDVEFNISKLTTVSLGFDGINSGTNNLADEVIAYLDNTGVINAVKKMLGVYESLDPDKDAVGDMLNKMAKGADTCIKDINKLSKTKGAGDIPKSMQETGFNVTKHGHLLGNKALYSYYPTDGFTVKSSGEGETNKDFLKKFDKAGTKIGEYGEKDKAKGMKTSFVVPKPETILGMTKNQIHLLNSVLGYREQYATVKKLKSDITAAGTAFFKTVEKMDKEPDNKQLLTNIGKVPERLTDLLDRPSNDLINLTTGRVSAVLALIKLYVDAY